MQGNASMRRWRRQLARVMLAVGSGLVLAAASFTALLAWPEPLFGHSVSRGQITVYARAPIDARILPHLDSAQQRLNASALHRDETRYRVFVAGSPRWYAFFTGPGRHSMAKNVELRNAIFLPAVELDRGRVVQFDGRSSPIASIVAHEATHTDVQRVAGGMRALWRLSFWQKEGYAEVVGHGDSLSATGALALLRSARDGKVVRAAGDTVPRHYFEAELFWRYLMQIRGRSPAELLGRPIPPEAVAPEMRRWADAQP